MAHQQEMTWRIDLSRDRWGYL